MLSFAWLKIIKFLSRTRVYKLCHIGVTLLPTVALGGIAVVEQPKVIGGDIECRRLCRKGSQGAYKRKYK